MENLPIYEIGFDPEQFESGVDAIALTETPAIEVWGMRFKSQEQAFQFFTDSEKMIIAGPAMVPDKLIYRREGDQEYFVRFSRETIESMAAKFNSEERTYKFNIEHDDKEKVAGYVKENWIIEDSEVDKSKLYNFSLPVGTWFVVAQITDREVWDDVIKSWERVGFSVEGLMNIQIDKSQKTDLNSMEVKKTKKKFFAKRISLKRKFSVTKKAFEDVLVTDEEEVLIVEDLATGAEVEMLDDNAEMVTAPDGTYEIPSEDVVIEVQGGEIVEIEEMPAGEAETEMAKDETQTEMAKDEDEEEKYEEKKEEKMEMDPEMLAKIIELESRLESLEAKMSEAENEEFKAQKFANANDKSSRLELLRNLTK